MVAWTWMDEDEQVGFDLLAVLYLSLAIIIMNNKNLMCVVVYHYAP